MAGLTFRRRKKRINIKVLKEALVWIGEVVLAFGFACILVYFFGAALSNVGQSMEPAIYSGDQVLVNRFIYRIKAPTYGDLVVFKPNGNENAHYHIKRVVGLPGDTVTIESGRVFINISFWETIGTTVKTVEAQILEMSREKILWGWHGLTLRREIVLGGCHNILCGWENEDSKIL